MKKILLINPAFKGNLHSNIKVLAIPPLNLAMIAQYTSEQYEVEIIDEAVEELDFDISADLVGITCMTPLAPRAYELAIHFRKRGVPIVMGGIRASYMPEEALRYAGYCGCGGGRDHLAAVAGRLRSKPDAEDI